MSGWAQEVDTSRVTKSTHLEIRSRHIWSYEVDSIDAKVQPNLIFMMIGSDTDGGVALLPKRTCNVHDVELAQLLVAAPNIVK